MNLRFKFLSFLFVLFSVNSFAQTQKDTIYTVKSVVPVVVDGSDADAVWSKSDWKPINQVWIPYAAKMAAGDFEGKYKVAWDSDYLYLLVQVVDNMISDDHAIPTQNWWDDDCVEVFLDEDRSKGDHEKNNNAFAYHVSTKYDAIDVDASGNGVNYKNNLKVVMDTIGTNTYLWEMAIKVYNSTFKVADPEASRVKLTPKKLMGFTLAYCDNDQGTTRENFIGSMYMTSATANDNYKTANYFGSMLLVDKTDITQVQSFENTSDKMVRVFPNPAQDVLQLEKLNSDYEHISVEVRSITGTLLKTTSFNTPNQTIDMKDLASGIYLLTISSGNRVQTERIMK